MSFKPGFTKAALAAAFALVSSGASAQYSDGVIKLGVLNDMSGLYADITGTGSLWAARKAVEGEVLSFCSERVEHARGVEVTDVKITLETGADGRWWLRRVTESRCYGASVSGATTFSASSGGIAWPIKGHTIRDLNPDWDEVVFI